MNETTDNKLYIAISGMIGAGKTTIAGKLGELLKLPVYYEQVIDNAYLEDFYKDPKTHAFSLQIYLLNNRFEQQQQIIWQGKGGIQDRSIYEDLVFCTMLKNDGIIEQRNFDTYKRLFNNMSNFMKRPNLIVHLDVSPEESLKRIRMRKRECETGISIEYLRKLHVQYKEFLKWISKEIPVIHVNYSKFREAADMALSIKKEWEQMTTMRKT